MCLSDEELPADVEQQTERVRVQLEDRAIIVINDPHLLQPDLNHLQIAKRVKECVYLSDPGPHAIILVLQHNDFNEENIRRVKYVLKQFSDKAIKHTIVLTTDKETLGFSLASVIKNNAMHQLIKECGGGHIHFDQRQPGCYSEIIQRVEKIKDEYEKC
ncbi:hypothetical protein QQF64_021985 [Cirrhinus molitorella]|uniref:AIG1-type G domain-containing protein n=1 Tax=Cirrhinus molitorella TaxID=172907 RepID=A0ABR3LAH7_9TELE